MGTNAAASATPTSAPAQTAVKVTMTVKGIKYDELNQNATLLESFKTNVKQALAAEAGADILPEHITLTLSNGSVIVEATITPPAGVAAADVQASMGSNPAAVAAAVTD